MGKRAAVPSLARALLVEEATSAAAEAAGVVHGGAHLVHANFASRSSSSSRRRSAAAIATAAASAFAARLLARRDWHHFEARILKARMHGAHDSHVRPQPVEAREALAANAQRLPERALLRWRRR